MNKQFLKGWSFLRVFRLVFAIVFGVQAFFGDLFAALISSILFYQVYTNTGCCGTSACDYSAKPEKDELNSVIFEEVKSK